MGYAAFRMQASRTRLLAWIVAVLAAGGSAGAILLLAVGKPGAREAEPALPEPSATPVASDVQPSGSTAREQLDTAADDRRLDELDARPLPLEFADKYGGLEPRLVVRALQRVDERLTRARDEVLNAVFETGRVTRLPAVPGELIDEQTGSVVRIGREVWQPYGVTQQDVAELDLAQHPDTRALWLEQAWLKEHVPAQD